MLKRPESELQFVRSRDPLPTVEVDLDSIPEDLHGYGELVTKAVASIAVESQKMRATIYVYQGPSNNFNKQTWSAFFGVAGEENLLNALLNAFQSAKVVNVRFSDYIDPSTATRDFHVQDGCVWRPLESGTWYAESPDETESTEDTVAETDDFATEDAEAEESASRSSTPRRFRAARSDATVGTIRKNIEEVFGLPEGSVALCGPDKNALRGNATIATLRRRWE